MSGLLKQFHFINISHIFGLLYLLVVPLVAAAQKIPVIDTGKCNLTANLSKDGAGVTPLNGGEIHCYKITVPEDQYARFIVQQDDIDLFLQLFDEDGVTPLTAQIDSPNDKFGPEPVAIAFQNKTNFVLGIKADPDSRRQVTRGTYRILVDQFRQRNAGDLVFARVEPDIHAGDVQRKFNNPAAALTHYEPAWKELESVTPGDSSQTRILIDLTDGLAVSYFKTGQYGKAKLFAELQTKFDARREVLSMGSHYILGNFYQNYKDFDRAIDEYEDVAKTFAIKDAASEVDEELEGIFYDSENRRAELYLFSRHDIQKGVQVFEDLAKIQLQKGRVNNAAYTLATEGAYYFEIGLVARASELYERAVKLNGVTDPYILAHLYENRGVALLVTGNFEEALNSFEKVEKYAEEYTEQTSKTDDEALAYARHGQAIAYINLNKFDLALQFLEKAFKMSSPGGKAVYLDAAAFEHLYLGRIFIEAGSKAEAEAEIQKAIELWDKVIMERCGFSPRLCAVARRGSANAINNIGEILYKSGDKTLALQYFKKALEIQNGINIPLEKDRVLTNLAMVDADNGDFTSADAKLKEALPISQSKNDRLGEASVLAGIAKVAKMQNKLDEALEKLSAVRNIVEDIRKNIGDDDLRAGFFSTQRKIFDLYEDTLIQQSVITGRLEYAEKALEISEGYKARNLYDILTAGGVPVRRNVSSELLDREKQLKDKVAVLAAQSRMFSDEQKRDKSRNPSGELTLAIAELGKVSTEIKNADPRFAKLSDPITPKWKKIREKVSGDDLVIEFYVGDKKTYVWAFGSTGPIHSYSIDISKDALQGKINELLDKIRGQAVSKVTDDNYKNLSREISKLLLGEIPAELWKSRILIVADRSLQYCPFAALPHPLSGKGQEWSPLIAKHEIIYVPSMSAMFEAGSNTPGTSKPFAGFISPKYVPKGGAAPPAKSSDTLGFPVRPLVFAEELLLPALAKTFKSARMKPADYKLYVGPDVNRKNLTNVEIQKYKYLLIYAHGLADETQPARSGIYLSLYDANDKKVPDFFLGLNDLVNLRLSADVVVLSACDAALGKDISGEGIVGITRGFMYTGSKAVIAPVWKVDEFWSEHLVERFLDKILVEKRQPYLALSEVQREMWTKQNLPPYYWAGFQFNGASF